MHNPQSSPGLRLNSQSKRWAWPVAVTLLALTVFGYDLAAEPHFVDESAYLSQSYFADLWTGGKWDDAAWLGYAGYDLPPLPKYVIGLALRLEGHRRPGPSAMAAWYRDTRSQFVSMPALVAARRPSVLFGAIGCLSIYALGTMALDRRVGVIAALLLMANPLYAMHARRAMSDVPAESLILASLAVGLWSWKRILGGARPLGPILALIFGAGVLVGLATLSKLNGALAGLVLGAWMILGISLPRISGRSKAILCVASLGAGLVSFATFVSLNPFLFAHPSGPVGPGLEPIDRMGFVERLGLVYDHRVNVSNHAKSLFPKDALNSLGEKAKVVLIQGFGRFGPLGPRGRTDSTVRFQTGQDWCAVLWLPLVATGLAWAGRAGRDQWRSGGPPTAWAVATQAGVALLVVTAFIPLAWDRYLLSIQPGLSLLGAFGIIGPIDLIRRRPDNAGWSL